MKQGFYWGNSSSSMQTEGAWNEGGKGPSVYDVREATEHSSDWKVATDSYHRYLEDFDYMQDLGMNMYRFQISWSRVVPDGDGDFNEEGIAFYDKFIDDLIDRGIEPMICLYHFDMPLSLAERFNGFVDKRVVDAFKRYAIEMIDRFGHKVKHWVTFNEQNLYSFPNKAFRISGYLEGSETEEELFKIQHNVMMAHAYVANYIHDHTDCKVSGMITYIEAYPKTCHPRDIRLSYEWDEYANLSLIHTFTTGEYSYFIKQYMKNNGIDNGATDEELEELSRLYSDYITYSYYASNVLNHEKITDHEKTPYYLMEGVDFNPYLDRTEWDWQIDAEGFRLITNKLYKRGGVPVFPIENGIGVIETWDGENPIQDDYRIEYHRDHLKALKDAMELDGVEVMGYLGWGLIDILSSQGDMRKRYGLVYVNRENHDLKDLKRVPKKSYDWFKNVTKTNGRNL